MCGIVGVVNDKDASQVLLDGLLNLEYRGYDSAGIYLFPNIIVKTIERVASLKTKVGELCSDIGIGHTRWATTGIVSELNAHPHLSYNKKITLVHNGIISNYKEIKDKLITAGYSFYSETDSEVIANYIEYLLNEGLTINKVLEKVLKDLKGELAIIFSIKDDKGLYFLKRGSPLVIGKNNDSFYLASDIEAIKNKVKMTYYPNDLEFGYLNKDSASLFRHHKKINIPFVKEKNEFDKESKENIDCYFKKEIEEQPEVIKRIKSYYIKDNKLKPEYQRISDDISRFNKVVLIGCGSSYNAANLFKNYSDSDKFETHIGSENLKINNNNCYIVISQSGETFDLIKTSKMIKKTGAKLIVLSNGKNSSLKRLSDEFLYMCALSEKSVAASKSYLASITILTLMLSKITNYDYFFKRINRAIKYVVKNEKELDSIALKISSLSSMYYIGKGEDKFLCDEGSLKLKEISYLHVESIYSGELKHGPIATINDSFGVLAISTDKKYESRILTSLEEVKCRNAPCFLFSTNSKISDVSFISGPKKLKSIGILIGLQILSYKVAKILNRDIDKPKNLAKSVTVI